MSKNLLVSFSGGRTSGFMVKFLLESPIYKDWSKLFVFANTGKEKEETLDFVNEVDRRWNLGLIWLEADIEPEKGKGTNYKIVNFKTASRRGEPFKKLIEKYGIPSKYYRHCTRDLKEIPMHKFARFVFLGQTYFTAIGIRADEKHRLSNDSFKLYPLAEHRIDEKVVRDFWDRQEFDLKLKDYQGNCDLCFLKSIRKKMTLIKENRKISDRWI